MSNSRWLAFLDMLAQLIQMCLPERIRRFCLYELQERVIKKKALNGYEDGWDWNITFEELYNELKD